MAQGFNAANAPFDRLSPTEIAAVEAILDIGYFRPGETLIAHDAAPESLFIVLKGAVEERDGEDVVSLRGPGDCFDSRALVQGGGGNAHVAREETLCHLLPREFALRLINQNPRFAAFFYLDITRKLDVAASEAEEARFGASMSARVGDLALHPAIFLDGADTIETAARAMNDHHINAVLVRDGERVGIVTRTDLADAAILDRLPVDTGVARIARSPVVCAAADDFVSTAMLRMSKYNRRRLAITDQGAYLGVLEDSDLLGFLVGNSRLVAARIDRAGTVADLAPAAAEIERQIRVLRRQGVKIEVVCEIVSDLNRRLMAKLFRLIAPPSIAQKGCLIVMGSEGRGEQTTRTDQDNGLILSEPVPDEDLAKFRREFTDALEQFGFPPCPGNVMVRNPLWSKTADAYRADVSRWLSGLEEDAHMNIAILYDAETVAGDPELLRGVKQRLVEAMSGERVHLAVFARAADAFPSPIGLFNNLVASPDPGGGLDLKKSGIFPIVHGARSLAIEHRLMETGTVARIERLAEAGVLRAEFARDLGQALLYLMTLRLDGRLAVTKGDGRTRPASLSTMERDLLLDALRIVKGFRELLRRHFNLHLF